MSDTDAPDHPKCCAEFTSVQELTAAGRAFHRSVADAGGAAMTAVVKHDTIPLDSIVIGERHRRDMGDIAALADSIEAIGLLHPVVIDKANNLIAGERRIRAHQMLGRKKIPVTVVDIDAIVLGEMAENEVRKDFTVSERVAIGKAVEANTEERRGRDNPQNLAELKGKETRTIAAEKSGFGNAETYRQAKAIVEKGVPELIEAVEQGQVSVSAAADVASVPVERQRDIVAVLPRGADGKLTPAARKALGPVIKEIRAERVAEKKAQRVAREIRLGSDQLALPAKKSV